MRTLINHDRMVDTDESTTENRGMDMLGIVGTLHSGHVVLWVQVSLSSMHNQALPSILPLA